MDTIYTIGFTKKSLKDFVTLLKGAAIRTVVDIRLRNTSQLAGWSKYPDFAYILETGFGIRYEHHPEFAPTGELLDRYKLDRNWARFEIEFNELLAARTPSLPELLRADGNNICLLCTEPKPERCHRRLVAQYLTGLSPGSVIEHL